METDFSPKPHQEAVDLLQGKQPVAAKVFHKLLPEIKARAFTVSGISSMDALQRIRDAVASVPQGTGEGGQTWDQAKAQIVDELDPYLGDGADYRATLVLRTNGFQAFSTSVHRVGMEDEVTTHFQYLHGECKVPTPSHLALNGIVLPKTDPFWETHTGPWGHLGCMCYKRTMDEDQVADEKADDEKRQPDQQNVITGPALKQLRHGDIIRAGVHYNVDYDGPDNSGFKWSPGDFKIPLKDLEAKYDPETWSDFQTWAQSQALNDTQSVWDWLTSTDQPSVPAAKPAAKPTPPIAAPPAVQPSPFDAVLKKFKAAKMSDAVMNKITSLPPAIAPLMANMNVAATRGRAKYSTAMKTVFLRGDPANWNGLPATAIHEVGHHLDYESGAVGTASADPKFKAEADADWKQFQRWAEKEYGSDWRMKLSNKSRVAIERMTQTLGYTKNFADLDQADQYRVVRFTDTIMGLSGGQYGLGHKPAYMRINGLKEVFTHAWSALVDNDQEFARLFPGVTAAVRRILKL